MNIHQQHLLELLKEVDALCKEHSITYYCAGGTVIGAARHRGFIPWDDDIDIYMTRSEFSKFADALEKYGPADRKLEYYEADNDRRAPVPRYHRDTDTMFCHFHLLGRSCAGTSLDVFVLDPIPDDYEARVDYIAKLFAYSDLIAPCHVYSHRLPTSKYDIYDNYKKIADEQGTPRAIEMISEEIFQFDESECSCYCLRWGSVILIYPIEVIGEPTWLPFEDMMIPVPHDWYRYLVIHYGMDWANLPYDESQGEHINIVRYDMKYDWFYEKRDQLYDQSELLDLHSRWKEAERDFFRAAEPIDRFVADIQNRICRAEIEKRLARVTSVSLEELFDEGEYEKIIEIYAPYFDLQFSHAYMGRNMKHGIQFRWLFPFIMPLDEKELHILLASLFRTGRQRNVEKIIGIYKRGNVQSNVIDEAEKIIGTINTARCEYYMGNYDEALKYSDKDSPITALNDVYWLGLVQSNITDNQTAELRNLAIVTDNDTDRIAPSESVRKAYGDCLWNKGRKTEAESVYRDLMKNCRNGLFWLDIQSKIPDIDPIPTKRLTPFNDTPLTRKQRELLEEISDICQNNGIKYVLGPDLARRIFLTGNIGYINSNREVFMDVPNAIKFMDAFKGDERIDRSLLSWEEGDTIRDFALIYSDKSKMFCDFRRLDQWRDMGIFITIRILRSNAATKAAKRKVMLDEFIYNLINLEQIDKRNLQSIGKKLAYSGICLMSPRHKSDYGRKLFERSITAEQVFDTQRGKSDADFYYYTNVRGVRPVKHKFSRKSWENTSEVEMNGVKYTVPLDVTAKYVPHETDLTNVAPINSVFICRSDDLSWDEINPLIDDAAYSALDWDTYSRTRKKYRKIGERVWHAWWMVLKLGEELDLNENAAETVETYRMAIESGNKTVADDAISSVDAVVKKYASLNVPIDLEPSLSDCYEDYLKRSGQKDFIKTISVLSKQGGGTKQY